MHTESVINIAAIGPDDWRGYFVTNGRNYLADIGDHAIGLVRVVGPDDGSNAELMSLWVAPEARGRGVGAALVNHCWTWLQVAAPGAVLQLSVRRHNRAARQLYQGLGFTFAHVALDDPSEDVLIRQPPVQLGPG